MDYWRMDVDDVELVDNAPITPREWVRSGVLTGLERAMRDAQKIFDLNFTDEIGVTKQLRLIAVPLGLLLPVAPVE